MKYARKFLLGLVGLLLLAALLLWFLPARWIVPRIEPRLHGMHLQQVHGTVWNGHAEQVTGPAGQPIGQLQWHLSRRALLGAVQAHLKLEGPELSFSGAIRRLPDDRIAWSQVQLRAGLQALDRYPKPSWGRPLGELRLSADHAVTQAGWPMELQAQAQWLDAVVDAPEGQVVLGNLQLEAEAAGGVVQVRARDDGHGPLQLGGSLQLSPLGWRLDATLHPRQTDPILRRWLARWATPTADGTVRIQRSGGLAGSLPAARPH